MNIETETNAALLALAVSKNNRQTNAALRRISVLFWLATRAKNAACRDILHEKLNNYNFDASPYIPA